MQSSNMQKNKVDSTFYSGNDTLGISYAFNNIDGSVRVRFENYTEKSMIIDLTKSALIVNGKSQAFIDGPSFVQGRLGAQASTIDWSNDGTFTALSEVNQSGAIVGTVLVLGGLGVAAALVNPGEAQ